MSEYNKYFKLRERFRALFERHSKGDLEVASLLSHLREFCRADSSCVVIGKDGRVDTHATAVAEGRREVYLRIVAVLNLTDADLIRLRDLEND